MRITNILLYFTAAAFGAWYVIRKSNSEHVAARKANDPQLQRSVRWYDAGMVTLVCGILLMLAWMVAQDASRVLRAVLLGLGVGAIVAGFVLSGISGWIKGGTVLRSRDGESDRR